MTTEDEVMHLLRRADPDHGRANATSVDGADYLAALRGRSTTVTLIDTQPNPTQPEGRRRWPIIAVAAAAVVAIVAGGLVIATRDDDQTGEVPADRPTTMAQPTTPAQPTTTTQPATIGPVDSTGNVQIRAMVGAWNAGRLDEFMSVFAPAARFYGVPLSEHRANSEAFMAAHDQWTLNGCAPSDSNTVTCDSSRRDDFHGAGGLVLTEQLTFEFDTEGLITSYGTEPDVVLANYYAFDQAFEDWLIFAHPDVSRNYRSFLYDFGPLSKMPRAQKVPTALEYVDEFVTQSDDY